MSLPSLTHSHSGPRDDPPIHSPVLPLHLSSRRSHPSPAVGLTVFLLLSVSVSPRVTEQSPDVDTSFILSVCLFPCFPVCVLSFFLPLPSLVGPCSAVTHRPRVDRAVVLGWGSAVVPRAAVSLWGGVPPRDVPRCRSPPRDTDVGVGPAVPRDGVPRRPDPASCLTRRRPSPAPRCHPDYRTRARPSPAAWVRRRPATVARPRGVSRPGRTTPSATHVSTWRLPGAAPASGPVSVSARPARPSHSTPGPTFTPRTSSPVAVEVGGWGWGGGCR